MAPPLSYESVAVRRLDAGQIASWLALLRANDALTSPFFRPEYTLGVAAVRDAIEVVVIRDGPTPVGFYPFERIDRFVGRPVGGSMSNFQGVIAAPATAWNAVDLAREASLTLLKFHHQVPGQAPFAPYTVRQAASPVIDVSGGWDAYLAGRAGSGVNSFNALPRKMRKLERDLGALTFHAHVAAPDVFDRLVEWKRAQYVRTNTPGSLARDWAVAALRELMRTHADGFSGMLSALYAGDRLIAAHAGIRSASAWHYWFPVYDPGAARHSPGLVLMFEMVKWAAANGIARIDLGPGEGPHKELFATSEPTVGVGEIAIPRLANFLQRVRRRLRRIAP